MRKNKFYIKIALAAISLIILISIGFYLSQLWVSPNSTDQTDKSSEIQEISDTIVSDSPSVIEKKLNENVLRDGGLKIKEQILFDNQLAYIDANTQSLNLFNLQTDQKLSVSKTKNDKAQLVMARDSLAWFELGEIWIFDFTTGSIVKATEKPGESPDLYEDSLVYRGLEKPGIYLYDIKNKRSTVIAANPAKTYNAPTIWQNIITWVDNTDGYLNAYYYDLSTAKTVKFTNFTEDRYLGNPLASKNSILYPLVDEAGIRRLYEYDLSTGKTNMIQGLQKGLFTLRIDKYSGSSLNYLRTNDEVVIVNLDSKEVKEFAAVDNRAVYGGLIIGNNKNPAAKYKVQR